MSLNHSQLGKRLAHIERELAEINKALKSLKPKRALGFVAAIPPASVCKDALSHLVGTARGYEGVLATLAAYYQIPTMGLYHNPKRVQEAERVLGLKQMVAAAYFWQEGCAYTKETTVDRHTVLHEFFHHLVAQGVVIVKGEDAELRANEFANTILQRADL